MKDNVRMLTIAILSECQRQRLEAPETACEVITAGLVQGLTHYLGELETVERLRDLADGLERQALENTLIQ